jgi:hypothetical protein
MNTSSDFNQGLLKALSDIPDMPDMYTGVLRSIKRNKNITRLSWACAGLLALCVTSFVYVSHFSYSGFSPEVFEELHAVQIHVNGDDIKEEPVSYSLLAEDY